MNRLAAQREERRGAFLECRHGALDVAAHRCGFHVGYVLGELGKPAYVPGQALSERRMKKTLQGAIEACEGVSDILEEPSLRRHFSEQPARQESDETGGVLEAVLANDRTGLLAERTREKTRDRQRGILLGQMLEHAQLAVDRLRSRLEIDDLEHVLAAVRRTQVEVAVAL